MRRRSKETISLALIISSFIFLMFHFYVKAQKKQDVFITITELSPVSKPIEKISDIENIETKEVHAVIYENAISLNELSTTLKKKKFIEMLLPSILIAKYRLEEVRERVVELKALPEISQEDSKFLNTLFEKYKTEDIEILLSRLATHPNSIVLAQAAVESGWGSSRFFLEANNIFGIWSFNKKEKRIPALGMRGDKTIYVRKYDSIEESIRDYFQTLGKGSSFKNFRANRLISSDPLELIKDLRYYSELREEYVKKLERVIEYNRLDKYDDYQLSKESFKSYSELVKN